MNSCYNQEISIKAYQVIWDKIIGKLIENYKNECLDILVKDNAQEIIWNNYLDFRTKCRKNYMSRQNCLLDRHKVCACMIYSIIKSSVITESIPKYTDENVFDTINEDLALTTGLSLLRAFSETAVRNDIALSEEEKELLLRKIDNGFIYPKSSHGDYRNNFLTELYFTKKEGNYNILSLAHTLFLLETFTKFY